MKSNRVFLGHILAETNFLIERTRTLSLAEFAADDVITRACTRSVEIIGEAVRNLSPGFRKAHGHAEWRSGGRRKSTATRGIPALVAVGGAVKGPAGRRGLALQHPV